jgi:hypothetical protein
LQGLDSLQEKPRNQEQAKVRDQQRQNKTALLEEQLSRNLGHANE